MARDSRSHCLKQAGCAVARCKVYGAELAEYGDRLIIERPAAIAGRIVPPDEQTKRPPQRAERMGDKVRLARALQVRALRMAKIAPGRIGEGD